jgi:phosphomannomutase
MINTPSLSGHKRFTGSRPANVLTPSDIIRYSAAVGHWTIRKTGISRIVIGRDARLSAARVQDLVSRTLRSLGFDVIDLGMAAKPTISMAVPLEKAGGGMVLCGGPRQDDWKIPKLLDPSGEVLDAADWMEIATLSRDVNLNSRTSIRSGAVVQNNTYLTRHIESILRLPLVDTKAIAAADFRIIVDGGNTVGGFAVPLLLRALGVRTVQPIFCEPDGEFGHAHDLAPQNLFQLSSLVTQKKADIGIAVDPDVERLSLFCEDGSSFGKDYLLIAIADHVLRHRPGNIVAGGEFVRALHVIAVNSGYLCVAGPAGESGLIEEMKARDAILGGGADGGVIYPELHFGYDALVAIALFLSYMARKKVALSRLQMEYSTNIIRH